MRLPQKLLSIACFERKKFFKLWNTLKFGDQVHAEFEQKLELVLEHFQEFRSVYLPREIRFISCVDADYPSILRELDQPPLGLFVRGDFSTETSWVSVVGSRKPTAYSLRSTREFCRFWAEKGFGLVSGGAFGIDAEAHRTAIEFRVPSAIVMGSGFAHLYPAAHFSLFNEVLRRGGCWISEYSPQSPGYPSQFPERNRLIAAMGEVLFLAQAHEKSGSLSTAKRALDLGKEIFVLQPPVADLNFEGSRRLLEAGAHPIASRKDLEIFYPDNVQQTGPSEI